MNYRFSLEITESDNKDVVKVALKEFFEEKEEKTVAISGVSGKWIKSLLVSLGNIRRFPKAFTAPSDVNLGNSFNLVGNIFISSSFVEFFDKFTWKTQNENVDTHDSKLHFINQMKKYGFDLENGDFRLYDVHEDHHLYDLEDAKLGKISGGTDFVLAPKDLIGESVRYNHCLALELKTTKRMEKDYNKLVNQTLLELIVASYWSDQKVVAVLSDMNKFAHTFELDYDHDLLYITEISSLPVEYLGFFIHQHLNASHSTNWYKLPQVPSNDVEKILVEFKKLAVTKIQDSEAYSQFMDLLDLTPKFSYERSEVIRNYFGKIISIPESSSIPAEKESSDDWKQMFV
jgi:hypothetical protein